jgi:DNA-directed RNA polymerase I, II, and III subunit RPABC1
MLNLELLSCLGRTKRVASIMMKDRGYELPELEKDIDTLSDLSVGAKYLSMAKSQGRSLGLALSSVYDSKEPSTVILFFNNNYDEVKKKKKMVSCDQAKQALEIFKNDYPQCSECILISPGKLSPDAKKEVVDDKVTVLTHEFFTFPIGRHCLVPKHEALTESDAKKFTQFRKIESNLLPQLKLSDPVSQYYGYKIGTIVKISRSDWTVYRVVTA